MKRGKYTIIEKAWRINLDNVSEDYLYGGYNLYVYADTRGKAKSLLYERFFHAEVITPKGGIEDISYLSTKVNRAYHNDKIDFNGKTILRSKLNYYLWLQERNEGLKLLQDDESIEFCFIKKRHKYYRPNSCGYTEIRAFAGVYTKKEALKEARGCEDITLVPIDKVEYVGHLNELVTELEGRINKVKGIE